MERSPTNACDESLKMTLSVGYYESWAVDRPCGQFYPKDIDPTKYTHLIFAFA